MDLERRRELLGPLLPNRALAMFHLGEVALGDAGEVGKLVLAQVFPRACGPQHPARSLGVGAGREGLTPGHGLGSFGACRDAIVQEVPRVRRPPGRLAALHDKDLLHDGVHQRSHVRRYPVRNVRVWGHAEMGPGAHLDRLAEALERRGDV